MGRTTNIQQPTSNIERLGEATRKRMQNDE